MSTFNPDEFITQYYKDHREAINGQFRSRFFWRYDLADDAEQEFWLNFLLLIRKCASKREAEEKIRFIFKNTQKASTRTTQTRFRTRTEILSEKFMAGINGYQEGEKS